MSQNLAPDQYSKLPLQEDIEKPNYSRNIFRSHTVEQPGSAELYERTAFESQDDADDG